MRSENPEPGAAGRRTVGLRALGAWLLGGLLLGSPLLAGCTGSGPDANPSSPAGSSSGSRAGTEVVIWADPELAPALVSIGESYTRLSGRPVSVTPVPAAEMLAALTRMAPQGTGPDLFVADSPQLGELVGAGLVAPVRLEDRRAGFTRWSLDAFRLAGTDYAMPFAGDGLALLRNAALAPKTPKSIEAMARTGQKLVAGKRAAVAIALPMGSKGDAHAWYPFYSGAGGYLFGQQGDGSYDPDDLGIGLPGSVQAGRLLADMVAAGDLNPKLDHDGALALFRAGRTPYLVGGLADARSAAAQAIAVVAEPVPDYASVPEGNAGGPVSCQGMLMSAFSHDRAAAADFLNRGLATTTAMDLLYKAAPALPAWAESLARAATDPVVAGFAASAEASGSAPNIELAPTAWRELSAAQAAVLAGTSPAKAMTAARKSVLDAAARGQ